MRRLRWCDTVNVLEWSPLRAINFECWAAVDVCWRFDISRNVDTRASASEVLPAGWPPPLTFESRGSLHTHFFSHSKLPRLTCHSLLFQLSESIEKKFWNLCYRKLTSSGVSFSRLSHHTDQSPCKTSIMKGFFENFESLISHHSVWLGNLGAIRIVRKKWQPNR